MFLFNNIYIPPVSNVNCFFCSCSQTYTKIYTLRFTERTHLFLFSNQFDDAGWLLMAFSGAGHWVLAAADLQNVKILMYNSLWSEEGNRVCTS